jgi:dihydrolipoamide dehydrogenase
MLLIKTIKLLSADHIIIATDSLTRVINLPQDGIKVLGYRQAMTLPTQPKSMIIVGSGAMELNLLILQCMGTELLLLSS